ncbi:uncharacterized protein LOC117108677 [Anneissia japonica]|uniref:uncharacterized protein LOC117108677 n=1 Tax=Anneissia japonica TaxID=1529436 RepID=UPI0014258ADA|nr:uncharacterized protein LOC117108677 [Anneissia japonica]
MFSPLYVGLYLYKSYTGEEEDDGEQLLVCGENEKGSVAQVLKKETGISDQVKSDDAVDGSQRNTEDQSERINDLLCLATENNITTITDLSSQSLSIHQDPNDDKERVINEKCDSNVTNNNNCTSGGLLSDGFEYPTGGEGEKDASNNPNDNDDDETSSVEFVDSQPFEEDIRSAEIKQNQQLVGDLMEPNQMQGCNTLVNATITPSNIPNNICVAETMVLGQDLCSQNESMFYEDIKQKSSQEVSKPWNNDRKASSAQRKSAKGGYINDLPLANGFELDSPGQSNPDEHGHYPNISDYNNIQPRSCNEVFNSNSFNTSGKTYSCSEDNPVDSSSVSTIGCTKEIDYCTNAPADSCYSKTIGAISSGKSELDNQLPFSSNRVLKETDFASLCTTHSSYNDGCSVDKNKRIMCSSSANEVTANFSDLSANTKGALESKCADSNQEVSKLVPQNSCKQNVEPSLGKSDFLSNSDDLSDLSDTVAADDLSSNSSISDLPEDVVTSSSAIALSRPSNLDLSSAAIMNNEITPSEDVEPSVISPSKVSVTCITEEETITVEEVFISPNHHHADKSFSDTLDNKRKSTLLPEATSNCMRSCTLSSTERLDFDWNEHCLRMIVTGTPENSLKVAVAGTPTSSENQGRLLTGRDRISQSNDFSDANEDMQDDVETLRLKVENKNEEILRLKNITEGLRHRLTKVEQQNMRLSQSSDSFLSVPSERPSSSSSCYDSVVSLSYEGNIRSPSLEENFLLKEEIHLLKSQLESKSDTIRRLNSKTNAMKARLIEEEKHVKTDSENKNNAGARRKVIRPVKSVNDISVEEKPRMLPICTSGSASSVFVNSTTVPINSSLSEQTSKKKKKRRLFSFGKKKDKKK